MSNICTMHFFDNIFWVCMGESLQEYSWIFRILRLTFCGKSASKCWTMQAVIASPIYFQIIIRQLTIRTWNCYIFAGKQQVLIFEFLKFRISEIINFHPWVCREHYQLPTECIFLVVSLTLYVFLSDVNFPLNSSDSMSDYKAPLTRETQL